MQHNCNLLCLVVRVCHRGGGHKPREGQREDVHNVLHTHVPRHDQQEVPVCHEAGVRGPGGDGMAAGSECDKRYRSFVVFLFLHFY